MAQKTGETPLAADLDPSPGSDEVTSTSASAGMATINYDCRPTVIDQLHDQSRLLAERSTALT